MLSKANAKIELFRAIHSKALVGLNYFEAKIGKKGKELNSCHWLKIWLSDVSATTVAFFSKRWKLQMLNGVLLEYVIDV